MGPEPVDEYERGASHINNGAKVTRSVTMRPDGVETLTESDDPAITKTIQAHVVSM